MFVNATILYSTPHHTNVNPDIFARHEKMSSYGPSSSGFMGMHFLLTYVHVFVSHITNVCIPAECMTHVRAQELSFAM